LPSVKAEQRIILKSVPECPPEVAMSLTKDFFDNPLGFLGDYIVVVLDDHEGCRRPNP
jgi:hypothetical protein